MNNYISLKELEDSIHNIKKNTKNPMKKILNNKRIKKIKRKVEKQNKKFIELKTKENIELFNNIKGCKLDKDQVKAILIEEDSCLVIAGAGSGKTLTMLGKIKYLIEKKEIDPKKILCISFTNAITTDLKNSIKEELNIDMEVLTFHKLGLKVLKENNINAKIVDENKLKKIVEYVIKYIDKEEMKKYFSNELELKKIIITFINLYKSGKETSLLNIKEEIEKEKNRFIKNRNIFLIKIIEKVYNKYQKTLEINEEIDFNDMINEASSLIIEGYRFPKYDYIIIDEYQDTSYARYKLLKAIKDKNNCPLLAVGDDWQSIYRFTGCDIQMFTEFKKYFEYSYITKIQKTYRNPQQLIDIAGMFVMKNPNQYKKYLKSDKFLEKPIKIFLYEKEEEINLILKEIPQERKEILILGRNNEDLNEININGEKIKKLTVHKSKGLQSDTVIIINLKDNITGFPNQITDDAIFKYLLNKEIYPFEEERRLFYVALTRTKNEVYLFTPKNSKSCFIDELIHLYQSEIEILSKKDYCKKCGKRYINNKCEQCKTWKYDIIKKVKL